MSPLQAVRQRQYQKHQWKSDSIDCFEMQHGKKLIFFFRDFSESIVESRTTEAPNMTAPSQRALK